MKELFNKYKKRLTLMILAFPKFIANKNIRVGLYSWRRIAITTIAGLLLSFSFGVPVGVVGFIFFLFLLLKWKPTMLIVVSLCLLLLCPLLTIFKKTDLIEQLSIWIFLLLFASIILQIIFYRTEK
ncbi:hypothetical protein KKF05_03300 [Patescibacteria group bacterium]|nr:hypothetical protein [Patescibacteria group bacterium]